MNQTHNRLLYPGSLPALDLSPNPMPSWQPFTLQDSKLEMPLAVANLLKDIRWDWIFDLSCNLAGQFRSLGMICPAPMVGEPAAAIMVDDPRSMSAEATAHAWVLSMVQRTAMEIRQLELLDEPRQISQPLVTEISGIAYFASSENTRNTGKRLTKALCQIASGMTDRCDAADSGAGESAIQFMHTRPVQLVSPVVDETAVPVAAYRVRFSGISVRHVIESLREALAVMHGEEASPMEQGDVLVLSSLWADGK
jgi:hypothetical protein